jgi:hypothetical protein
MPSSVRQAGRRRARSKLHLRLASLSGKARSARSLTMTRITEVVKLRNRLPYRNLGRKPNSKRLPIRRNPTAMMTSLRRRLTAKAARISLAINLQKPRLLLLYRNRRPNPNQRHLLKRMILILMPPTSLQGSKNTMVTQRLKGTSLRNRRPALPRKGRRKPNPRGLNMMIQRMRISRGLPQRPKAKANHR